MELLKRLEDIFRRTWYLGQLLGFLDRIAHLELDSLLREGKLIGRRIRGRLWKMLDIDIDFDSKLCRVP